MENTVPDSALPAVIGLGSGRLPVTPIKTVGLAYTVSEADRNAILQCATDNGVITLPLAADVKGMEITVQNTGAATAALVSISPNAADKVVGTVMAVSSGGVVNKDWRNTKATSKQGDYVTLVSDGGTIWWIIAGMGVWASEP